ncbi:MAG: TrbI/VirB10 family protein, partial [Verrucomicrobiales bacterium]|nr:TrbI/VirB10 family protein [Verrucomicrobiales bacterium]
TLIWQGGEELHLKALALDREFSGDQEGWGITDGSAGLRGRVIKSDDLADIKLFAATFLSGAAGALTEKQQTVFGPINSPTLANAPFEGAQKVLSVYAQRIYDAIQKDGFYVRVPSGKQFYLYVLQTIDRSEAVVGGSLNPFAAEDKTNSPPIFPTAEFRVAPTPIQDTARPNSTPLWQP